MNHPRDTGVLVEVGGCGSVNYIKNDVVKCLFEVSGKDYNKALDVRKLMFVPLLCIKENV